VKKRETPSHRNGAKRFAQGGKEELVTGGGGRICPWVDKDAAGRGTRRNPRGGLEGNIAERCTVGERVAAGGREAES